jgi:hypothetical protein
LPPPLTLKGGFFGLNQRYFGFPCVSPVKNTFGKLRTRKK